MNGPIPVTVLTGFLGSGKTTLLTGLIKDRQARRLAILINEFGEISIDAAIVRESANDTVEIQIFDFPHALIAYGDDEQFVPAMQALAERRANIDHVLIETSGLAVPSAVMETLQTSELVNDFVLDATLAVVDTPLLLSGQFERNGCAPNPQAAAAALFEQQLENADIVVLNKIDDLAEDALLTAEAHVRKLAPEVRFLELAYRARLDIRLALGLRLHQPTFEAHSHRHSPLPSMPGPGAQPLADQRRLDGHRHSGLGAHTHGLATHKHFHQHDPGWLSFALSSPEPQETERLEAALLAAARWEPLLRVKGFIRSASDTFHGGHAVLVQAVRTRVTMSADAAKTPPVKSELVFIGYHLNRTKVAALLTELTGTAWK
ncbi:MAG: CobW family GTP-binding protein [Gammaproteobacteria bacterium]